MIKRQICQAAEEGRAQQIIWESTKGMLIWHPLVNAFIQDTANLRLITTSGCMYGQKCRPTSRWLCRHAYDLLIINLEWEPRQECPAEPFTPLCGTRNNRHDELRGTDGGVLKTKLAAPYPPSMPEEALLTAFTSEEGTRMLDEAGW